MSEEQEVKEVQEVDVVEEVEEEVAVELRWEFYFLVSLANWYFCLAVLKRFSGTLKV